MDRVSDLADPRRCKGAAPDGQCRNIAEPECEYCRAHGGTDKSLAKIVSQYKLTNARYRARLAELRGSDQRKSLLEEIDMTRLLIEEMWNQAKTDTDLLASHSTYNQLVSTLERLIKTCHAIEKSSGELLPRTAVIVFGREVVAIVSEEIKGIPGYEDKVDRISSRLFDTIEAQAKVLQEEPDVQ